MNDISTLRERARAIMLEIRFPVHHCGYRQLCEAIPMFALNPEISMTKELYPQLSAQFKRDSESSVRRAILHAWEHGNRDAWDKYFPNGEKAPSNLVFIATILELIK